ncbi:MAG: glycosyltransferase family 4 protein [Candidatus Heimdallarchaeaceae archaeon]
MNNKVCFLTQEYKRGATWIYCLKVAEEMKNLGKWQPHIITGKRGKNEGTIKVKVPIDIVITPNSRLFYSYRFWKESEKLVKKISPQIIHGNMNMLSTYGIKEKRVPIVETVHTTFSRERRGVDKISFKSLSWVEKRVRLLYPLLTKMEKKLLNRASRLIAVSNEIKRELLENYKISEDRITVIPTAVDISVHKPSKELLYKKKEDEFILGFLGRMTAGKGAHMLFHILKKVKEQIPNVKLLIAGDDLNSRQRLRKQLIGLQLLENVLDFGYIYDNQKKNAFFSSLDLFLLPSSHEGMSLALLEAIACETPVLTTPEAATFDHENTIFLTSRTIRDFANKIIQLHKNPEILKEKKLKSRSLVKKYNWNCTAQKIQNVYSELL